MGANFDTSEVERLALDLSRAPGRIQRAAPKTLEVGAFKIKKTMASDASGHGNLPGLAATVSYEKEDALGLAYIIGFEARGQGYLDNIAAFGTVNNAPVLDHRRGLRMELPSILRHLAADGESSVLGGDGR